MECAKCIRAVVFPMIHTGASEQSHVVTLLVEHAVDAAVGSERVGLLPNTQRFLHHIGCHGESVGFDNLALQFFGVSSVG